MRWHTAGVHRGFQRVQIFTGPELLRRDESRGTRSATTKFSMASMMSSAPMMAVQCPRAPRTRRASPCSSVRAAPLGSDPLDAAGQAFKVPIPSAGRRRCESRPCRSAARSLGRRGAGDGDARGRPGGAPMVLPAGSVQLPATRAAPTARRRTRPRAPRAARRRLPQGGVVSRSMGGRCPTSRSTRPRGSSTLTRTARPSTCRSSSTRSRRRSSDRARGAASMGDTVGAIWCASTWT